MSAVPVIVGYVLREALRRRVFAVVLLLTAAFLVLFWIANHYVHGELDRVGLDQPRHRLAYRHDGDAEHIGRRAQRQFFARRKPPGNQQIRELGIGSLAQRLSLERFHQIERGGQIQRKGSMLAQISAGLNFRERTRQRLCLLQL